MLKRTKKMMERHYDKHSKKMSGEVEEEKRVSSEGSSLGKRLIRNTKSVDVKAAVKRLRTEDKRLEDEMMSRMH